jgi:hypothetical protein
MMVHECAPGASGAPAAAPPARPKGKATWQPPSPHQRNVARRAPRRFSNECGRRLPIHPRMRSRRGAAPASKRIAAQAQRHECCRPAGPASLMNRQAPPRPKKRRGRSEVAGLQRALPPVHPAASAPAPDPAPGSAGSRWPRAGGPDPQLPAAAASPTPPKPSLRRPPCFSTYQGARRRPVLRSAPPRPPLFAPIYPRAAADAWHLRQAFVRHAGPARRPKPGRSSRRPLPHRMQHTSTQGRALQPPIRIAGEARAPLASLLFIAPRPPHAHPLPLFGRAARLRPPQRRALAASLAPIGRRKPLQLRCQHCHCVSLP